MTSPRAGTAWVAVDVLDLPEGLAVTTEFSDDTVGGSSGCNPDRATYAVENGWIHLGPIAATLMMRDAAAMAASPSRSVGSRQPTRSHA